jgi:hypothetical protein
MQIIASEMEDDFVVPEIYIPEIPNAVLFAIYTTRDTILLSMAGYDAGFMYEYSNPVLDKETVFIGSHSVDACNDEEIRYCTF